jgi:hypothetical protein
MKVFGNIDAAIDEYVKMTRADEALQAQARETENLSRASIAAAEFISTQTTDLLAITTLRKAFEYGYRVGWRDAKEQK